MEYRPPLGVRQQRPHPLQRAVSGGSYGSVQLPKRPNLPSRLSDIRSVSQPANVVDLTGDGLKSGKSNAAAFLGNSEMVVSSPDVIKIEDDEDGPPAKRAKTSGHEFRSGEDSAAGKQTDKATEVVPGSPLPSLPKMQSSIKRLAPRRHRLGIDPAARKANGIEPPTAATRVPPPKKVLDFMPWTGKQPEDDLSETVIKAGFFDKPQSANHNESNSGKASIWPNISQKNHHGLSMLGYLFTAVIEKRQAVGRCTAPSTFKPPPRVTVTDTKREAWLRDLANPEVPLRKQSRTIPHGIRGKGLLDQCLGKDIPLHRAVWFAKCVGANELRAFRRKGVSGSAAANSEIKWVREWTVNIEQFLDGVIANVGQDEWQRHMNYAVKLATAFYTERLLDTEHYLDWIVTGLSEATLERLPIWIVMTQMHWKDITSHGRRGRRLAESILEHLHRITEANSDVNMALKMRLQKLIAVIAVTNRGCLIIPRSWEKYKYLLSPKAEVHQAANTPAINIAKRNEHLAAPLYKTAGNTRSPLLNLYSMLDSIALEFNSEKAAQKCLALVPDFPRLISALLDWASTPFRTGTARIYLSAGIIVQLHLKGFDTHMAIIDYLTKAESPSQSGVRNVHKVIIELVRRDAFATGRYLQWLITSGALSSGEKPHCVSSLIAALPTSGLPLHVSNTRRTLMMRLGYASDEANRVNDVLATFNAAMAGSSTEDISSLPKDLTMSVRLSICERICSNLGTMAKDYGLPPAAFTVARRVIEEVNDISSLARLVAIALTSDSTALLAMACDTVNLHAESFAALGELSPLIDALSERYITLRSQQPLDKTFILALAGLMQRTPEKIAFVKLLGDDLAACEQQSSMAVCSPASDSLVSMHASTLDSDEDIEAVFASGNTMDEQLMQRVFARIIQRADKPLPLALELVTRVHGWLNQLRSVDGNGVFERLVHDYLRTTMKGGAERKFSPSVIALLLSSDCISFASIAHLAKDVKSPQVAATMLLLAISEQIVAFGIDENEQYRFRLQQERCQLNHADALITLLRTACEIPDFVANQSEVIKFVIRCTSVKSGSVRRVFEDGQPSNAARTNARHIITGVLQLGQNAQNVFKLDIRSLVSMANAFSVGYCIQAIRYLKTSTHWSRDDDKTLGDAILDSFNDMSDVWPQLLEFAGESINRMMYGWALNQLLNLAMKENSLRWEYARELRPRCQELVMVTNRAANRNDDTGAITHINDLLKRCERQLSQSNNSTTDTKPEIAYAFDILSIVLPLSVLYVHDISEESEASKQIRGSLLSLLCSLLVHPKLQTHKDVLESLFDLASTLSDSLADVFQTTHKLLDLKLPLDTRLNSIIGSNTSSANNWLALASHVHLSGSQQQRALSRYPSQQPQMNGRPLPSPQMQQSPTQLQSHQRWPSSSGPFGFPRQDSRMPTEMKMTPFSLRRWEIMPDPTPVMGENDTSLSLGLFGARKV